MEKVLYMNDIYDFDGTTLTDPLTGKTRKVSIGRPFNKSDIEEKIAKFENEKLLIDNSIRKLKYVIHQM